MDTSGGEISRRKILGFLALALGSIASLPLVLRLFESPSKKISRNLPLPGKGSIFQPRRDARLEEWERRHGRTQA